MTSKQMSSDPNFKNGIKILDILERAGYSSRFVGGCVRDKVMGLVPKDYDIATTALPEETTKVLKNHKIKALPIGIEHGTITAVISSTQFEITTLRVDAKTDGRKAEVHFGTDFREDAKRRDFTMNAMYEDKEGVIYDYFSGREDIQKKTISFVGSPKVRIQEDYLRILRYFRFAGRFGLKGSRDTETAIKDEKDGLKIISGERKLKELMGILESPTSYLTLRKMLELGIMSYLLPQSNFSKKDNESSFALVKQLKLEKTTVAPLFSLAGLIFDGCYIHSPSSYSNTWIHDISSHLRLSNRQRKFIEALISTYYRLGDNLEDNDQYFTLIDDFEKNTEEDAFLEYGYLFLKTTASFYQDFAKLDALEQAYKLEKKLHYKRTAELPLKTKDVIAISGIKPGSQLGELLADLKRSFRNEIWSTEEDGKKYINNWLEK